MNWDQVKGNWKQVKGKAQQVWGDLAAEGRTRLRMLKIGSWN